MSVYYGTEGDDVVTGTSGDDDFYSSNGNDKLAGGDGWDRMFIDFSASPGATFIHHFVTATQGSGIRGNFINGTKTTETSGIEEFHVLAGQGRDMFRLNLGDYAGPLKFSIDAAGGAGDWLYLTVGSGSPAMIGTESGGTFVAGDFSFANFEILDIDLGSGNDNLTLGASNNRISAAAGDDYVDGGAGSDNLTGGAGSDTLHGGDGNDTLYSADSSSEDASSEFDDLKGGAGDDVIAAGYGDFADGGTGSDRLSLWLQAAPTGVTLNLPSLFAGGSFGFGGGTITGFESYARIRGTDFADLIVTGDEIGASESSNPEVYGGGGDDEIVAGLYRERIGGGAGNDVVRAGGGDDYVAGDEGNDRLFGEAGNDTLIGGSGSDELAGGPGDDVYSADPMDVVIEEEDGGIDIVLTSAASHTLAANVENLSSSSEWWAAGQLTGNSLANRILGGDAEESLDGGEGDDVLDGRGGNDRLYGGAGNDRLQFTAQTHRSDLETVDGGAGTDTLAVAFLVSAQPAGLTWSLTANPLGGHDGWIANGSRGRVNFIGIERFEISGTSAADSISGGALDDRLSGLGGNDILIGGAGNDMLDGGSGDDQMRGGAGDDIYDLVDGSDSIVEFEGEGTDEIRASWSFTLAENSHVEKLTGTGSTGVSLTGNGFANILTGNDGNDRLNGGGGPDTLRGGAGNDTYIVDDPGDIVEEGGGQGTDRIETSLASFSLAALPNVENLTGTSAAGQALTGNGSANVLSGGSGSDVLDGGAGADEMRGGFGGDVYLVDSSADVVVELSGAGVDEIRTELATYSLAPFAFVERLTGLSGQGQSLTGNGGSNLLKGGAGDDILQDNIGNDTLDGGAGADTMRGGLGHDIYVVDNSGDIVEENSFEGVDAVQTALASYSLAAMPYVENLTGLSAAGQTLTGNWGNNVVAGGAGNDNLRLQDGGDDTVLGGAGNDNLFLIGSLTSADVVNGGDGNDTLILQGAYAGGLTLSANVTNIELISILAGSNTNFGEPGNNLHDYVLTTHDSNFAAGIQARINGSALLAGEDFTFDGSSETDATFVVYGGRGKDTLTGSRNNDIFFLAEDRFATGDTVNGGAGYDGMFLRGNYTIDFNAPGYTGLFTNIENLTLTSATDERYARGGGTEFDYNLTLSDAIVKPGELLTVSGALLMASETMIVDASAETDGFLSLFAGKSNDTLKGGALADLLHGNLGADALAGGGGADVFRYQGVGESTASSLDQILDFEAGTDKVDLTRMDADTLTAGNQAFSWIGSNAFSGTAGQLRAYQDGANWFVEGDTNGDGVADLVIQLTVTGGPLSQGDFLP